ncbi:hypothetical protein [Actinomadura kijaniata]|uniref:hypothetical protein n=1 Tax=Actinomadura kijaniata TaxID=46161 RepID=UPI0012FAB20E|nr:hypothetical protein [Actinomadura kijaniata]
MRMVSVPGLARAASPTLEQVVRERGPLRGADLEALALAVARTLTGLHGADAAHGNLTPATVLLTPVGPRVHAPAPRAGRDPADDMLAWGRLVTFAATGDTGAAPPPDMIDRPLRDLVERALDPDARARPTALHVFATLLEDRAGAARRVHPGPLLAGGAGVTVVAAVVAGAVLAGRPDGAPAPPLERSQAPVAATALLSDAFDDPRSGWPRDGDGRYRDGRYTGRVTPAHQAVWLWRPQPVMPRRVLVSATVRVTAGAAGVFCLGQRLGDRGRPSLYELLVGPGGVTLAHRRDGVAEPLARGGAALTGEHRLRALCEVTDAGATRLALWVDGVKRADRTEPTRPAFAGGSGMVGLAVARTGPGAAEATFDDFAAGEHR